MNTRQTVFAQLMEFIPTYHFQICVDRYQGNRYVKDFSCRDQFLCLAFAQLTYRTGLRDIEACLRAQQPKLYHMGFRERHNFRKNPISEGFFDFADETENLNLGKQLNLCEF
jgi:hypothetical protein